MRKLRIPATFHQMVQEAIRVSRDPASALWAMYVFLFPVYVVPSGLPQPGDLLIFVLVPVAFLSTRGRVPKTALPALRVLFVFTGYVIIENIAWSVILNSWT